MILADNIPGTHPTIQVCSNAFFCTFNYDTLISSAIAIVLTLGLGFGVAYSLGHGKPRRLQMVLELLLGYIRNLTGEMVSDEAAGFVIPIAATIFIFVLLANWLGALPLAPPVEPAAADINLTLAMALAVIVIVQWYSIHVLGFRGYLRRFTKPFELQELVLRLRALDRRRAHNRPPVREIAGLRLDPFRREVYRDGRYVALTRKQFAVLEVLVAAEGGVVSAEELLERAWDENADPFTNAVRITVSALRKRLGEPGIIATVAGRGYRISTQPDTGRGGGGRG